MTTCTPNSYVTQLPGDLNLKFIKGDDFSLGIQWNIDITDYVFEAYIEPENQDNDIALGIEITSASSGKMNMIISGSSTSDLPVSNNEWFMNWTNPSGLKRTVLAGNLILLEE